MSSSFLENRCAASWEGNQRVRRQRIRVAASTSLLLPCLSAKSGSWHSNPIEIRFPSSLLLRPCWDKSRSWHHSPHIESRSCVSFLPWFLDLIGILAYAVRTESYRRLQYWKTGFRHRNVVSPIRIMVEWQAMFNANKNFIFCDFSRVLIVHFRKNCLAIIQFRLEKLGNVYWR